MYISFGAFYTRPRELNSSWAIQRYLTPRGVTSVAIYIDLYEVVIDHSITEIS
jgi:hypothetical protein